MTIFPPDRAFDGGVQLDIPDEYRISFEVVEGEGASLLVTATYDGFSTQASISLGVGTDVATPTPTPELTAGTVLIYASVSLLGLVLVAGVATLIICCCCCCCGKGSGGGGTGKGSGKDVRFVAGAADETVRVMTRSQHTIMQERMEALLNRRSTTVIGSGGFATVRPPCCCVIVLSTHKKGPKGGGGSSFELSCLVTCAPTRCCACGLMLIFCKITRWSTTLRSTRQRRTAASGLRSRS